MAGMIDLLWRLYLQVWATMGDDEEKQNEMLEG